jgi:hypothetical protein
MHSQSLFIFVSVNNYLPYHGAKEVPTGTCSKILKIIREDK